MKANDLPKCETDRFVERAPLHDLPPPLPPTPPRRAIRPRPFGGDVAAAPIDVVRRMSPAAMHTVRQWKEVRSVRR
eukprot:scaffold121103_cov32-Tisochrysis_lutea.AAC.1